MKKYIKSLCKILVLASPFMAQAYAASGWSVGSVNEAVPNQNLDLNSDYTKRFPMFTDDMTSDQDPNKMQLTALQKHQALVWGLSDDEEKRYVLLMQNQSGLYWGKSGETPVEILGLNARSNAERQYYADLSALQTAEKTAKELAFTTAEYNASVSLMQKLSLPVVLPFNVSAFSPAHYQPLALTAGDQLLLFIKPDDAVKHITSWLINRVPKTPNVKVAIYLVGATRSDQIEGWAKDQNFPIAAVNNGTFSLNFDNGKAESLGLHTTPAMILIRNGKSISIDTGTF